MPARRRRHLARLSAPQRVTLELFLIALGRQEMSQNAWADDNGVSRGHLSLVLSGHRASESLWTRVREWADDVITVPQR
jgi:hypothetical protein